MKDFLVRRRFLVVLIVILLLSAVLRFYNLGEKSFSADEFLGVNTSYGYLQTGEWRRWDFNLEKPFEDNEYFKTFFDFDFWGDGEDTYTRAWVYNWQVAQTLRMLPDSQEWSYRVVSVVWGILSVILIYLISFKFTGNKVIGIIASFLMALSLDGIIFSRMMRMYAMFMSIFLIFSYVAFNFFESKIKTKWELINKLNAKTGLNFLFFIPLIILGLLSMHVHLLTANFIFVALIYFILMAILQFKTTKNFFNHYVFYSGLGILMTIILFSNDNALTSSLGWQNHYSYLNKSFFDYSNWFLAGALIILGSYYLIKNKQREGVFIVSSYTVILFLAMFFWDRNVGAQYLFFIKPFQIMLIATGVWWVAIFLHDNLKAYNREIYLSSIVLILIMLINFGYFFQADNPYNQTSQSENPNYKKVFGYVLAHKGPDDVLVTRAFRNFYWQGSKIRVFSMGGERATDDEKKITLEKLNEIMKNNPSGWIVYSDNDENFISKDAQKYIDKNLIKINNLQTKGPINVYHWAVAGK